MVNASRDFSIHYSHQPNKFSTPAVKAGRPPFLTPFLKQTTKSTVYLKLDRYEPQTLVVGNLRATTFPTRP